LKIVALDLLTLESTVTCNKYLVLLVILSIGSVGWSECLSDIEVIYKQGQEYYSRSQYLLAAQQFSNYSLLNCSAQLRERGMVRWAQSLYELGEGVEGQLILAKIPSKSESKNTAYLVRAWYEPNFISFLNESDRRRFDQWNVRISKIPKLKNPWVSAGLSAIVPGAGQIYNEAYQSALFSFLLNALFLSTALEFQSKHMDAAAVTAGVMFSVVYVGNILGAAKVSNSINENYAGSLKEDIRSEVFPELYP